MPFERTPWQAIFLACLVDAISVILFRDGNYDRDCHPEFDVKNSGYRYEFSNLNGISILPWVSVLGQR